MLATGEFPPQVSQHAITRLLGAQDTQPNMVPKRKARRGQADGPCL